MKTGRKVELTVVTMRHQGKVTRTVELENQKRREEIKATMSVGLQRYLNLHTLRLQLHQQRQMSSKVNQRRKMELGATGVEHPMKTQSQIHTPQQWLRMA